MDFKELFAPNTDEQVPTIQYKGGYLPADRRDGAERLSFIVDLDTTQSSHQSPIEGPNNESTSTVEAPEEA